MTSQAVLDHLDVTGVMHEADDSYSIQSTCSYYFLDKFLTLALNTWISSDFSAFHWICLRFILLNILGVELSLCIDVLHPRMLRHVFFESN